ncbi:MAG: diguanylate cyclase [bacterium]|nr:diguanylate cyclase [bacterium]
MSNPVLKSTAPALEAGVLLHPLRVMLVEDRASDAQRVHELLREAVGCQIEVEHVPHLPTAASRAAETEFDLVLLVLSRADGESAAAIECAATLARTLPVVVLTGVGDDALALDAMYAGAAECIPKTDLGMVDLVSTVEREVKRYRRRSRGSANRAELQPRDRFRDPVTGLVSEELFNDRLEHSIARSGRTQEPFAVVALRLNELLTVPNETAAADLMCAAGERLSRRIRKGDTLARIGRDSFAVMINGLSEVAAVNSAVGSLVLSLSDVALPGAASFESQELSASVGVSIHPSDGSDTSALLDRATRFEFATARIALRAGPRQMNA